MHPNDCAEEFDKIGDPVYSQGDVPRCRLFRQELYQFSHRTTRVLDMALCSARPLCPGIKGLISWFGDTGLSKECLPAELMLADVSCTRYGLVLYYQNP